LEINQGYPMCLLLSEQNSHLAVRSRREAEMEITMNVQYLRLQ